MAPCRGPPTRPRPGCACRRAGAARRWLRTASRSALSRCSRPASDGAARHGSRCLLTSQNIFHALHGLIPRVAISLARPSVALALIQGRQGARRDPSDRYQTEHRVSGVTHRAGFIKASRGEPLLHRTGMLAVLRTTVVLAGQCVKPRRNEACQCRAWVTSGVRSCSHGSSPPASGPSGP